MTYQLSNKINYFKIQKNIMNFRRAKLYIVVSCYVKENRKKIEKIMMLKLCQVPQFNNDIEISKRY